MIIVHIFSFILLIVLLAKANASKNPDFIGGALAIGIIAPPVISFAAVWALKGYMEGFLEGIGFVFFAAIVVAIDGIYLIVKGRKEKNTSLTIIGISAIFIQILIGISTLKFVSAGFGKIGG